MTAGATFVLIPGAGGDPWFWHRVAAELQDRGHEAVSVDLPGAVETADLPDYVDAIVAAVGDRDEVVLVGQSLGGFSAVLACDRLPVSMLVLVNAMIPSPGETPGQWWDNTGQRAARRALDEAAGRDPDAEFDVMTYFLHDVPPEVLADASPPRDQAGRPFGTAADFPRWPDVPTRVIVGRDDRIFPSDFQRQLAMERLGVEADELPGGHLMALSHPVELTDQLLRYQAQVGSDK